MIQEFNQLEEEECNILFLLPVWVTLLIAGADDKIDDRELSEAVKLVSKKQEESKTLLATYYNIVARAIETNLKGYRAILPDDGEERNKIILEKLKQVNALWSRIDQTLAIELYESLKMLAKRVAEASGGILGYRRVSPEEAELLDLKVIHDPRKLPRK